MNVSAVIVAGGRRVGPDVLTPVAGVPMAIRSVRLLLASGRVDRVLLLVPDEQRAVVAGLCDGLPVDVRGPGHGLTPTRAHTGQRAGAAPGDDFPFDVVLVHDAYRPLAPPALVGAVLDAIGDGHDGVVPVLPLTDTVKLVDAGGYLRGTPDRSGLWVVQTPQAYRAVLLDPDLPSLDAALTLAAAGVAVYTVPGDPLAFAVRSAWDLELAELLVEEK